MAMEEAAQTEKKKWSWKKKIGLMILGLALIYIGISIYFMSHFFIGTEINGYESQLKNIEEVKSYMKEYSENYTLTLKERLNREETISASEIGLSFADDGKIEAIKKEQNGFLWVTAIWKDYTYEKAVSFQYDEEKLQEKFESLDCFDKDKIVKPKNAYPRYSKYNKKYIIVNEVAGNLVKEDQLKEEIINAIQGDEYTIDLEKADCYENPEYDRENEKVVKANKKLNKYIGAQITYDMGYTKEVVDVDRIHNWLSVDDNYKVTIDKEKIRSFMTEMGEKYNTVGKTRSFTTPGGSTISVSGGTYGWRLNQEDETDALYKLVKKGSVKEKEPLYLQEGKKRDENGDDIGDTYIAISISSQYMWYYKNGSCVLSTSVVTGDSSKGRSTPTGVYAIAYKQRNHTMKGDGYTAFVNYWLPYYEYRGIGIHDATWRSSFGGSIYQGNGSHGCVNTPYSVMQSLYEMVEAGTPVVVY
jgi:hypothetical protein